MLCTYSISKLNSPPLNFVCYVVINKPISELQQELHSQPRKNLLTMVHTPLHFRLYLRTPNSNLRRFNTISYLRTTPFLRFAITFSISAGLTLSYLFCGLTSLVSCALCSIDSTNDGGPSFFIGLLIIGEGNEKGYINPTKNHIKPPSFSASYGTNTHPRPA